MAEGANSATMLLQIESATMLPLPVLFPSMVDHDLRVRRISIGLCWSSHAWSGHSLHRDESQYNAADLKCYIHHTLLEKNHAIKVFSLRTSSSPAQSSLTPQKSVPATLSTRRQNRQYHPFLSSSHFPSSVSTGPSPIQSWPPVVLLLLLLLLATNQDRMGMWRRMRVVRVGWGRRASEIGRRAALRTVGIAVMYSPDGEEGGWRVVGREGTERERRAEVGCREEESSCWCWEGGAWMAVAVAVAEEAVVEDWDCGEGMEVSSRVVTGGWG